MRLKLWDACRFSTRVFVCGVLSVILLLCVGCQKESGEVASDAPVRISHSYALPDYSIEDYVAKSNLVVVATFESFSDPFYIESVDGADPALFTNAYFSVEQVVKGTPRYDEGQSNLTVRLKGGQTERVVVEDDARPALSEGQRYLLFLYRVSDGSDYNTEGNHYYVVNMSEGVWPQTSDGAFVQGDGARSTTLASLEMLVAQVASADEGTNGEEDGIRGGAAQGEGFARVMTDEEADAYEEQLVASINQRSTESSSGSSGQASL